MVAVIVVYGLLGMMFLWSGMMALVRPESPLPDLLSRAPLLRAVRLLLVAPPAVVLLVVALTYLAGDVVAVQVRIGHAVVLLGWWMAAALLLFALSAYQRLGQRVPVSALLGLLLAAAAIVYLTPISRFSAFFFPLGYDRALIIGVALVVMAGTVLRRLYLLAGRG